MELFFLGSDNTTLSINFDEASFTKANSVSQLKGACSSCLFNLTSPFVNSMYSCIIDMDELSAFYESISSFLSLNADFALFSSHDNLFYLKFIRNNGSIQCEYGFNQFQSPRTHVMVLFYSDEIQVSNCKKELAYLFSRINNNLYDKRLFTKWW